MTADLSTRTARTVLPHRHDLRALTADRGVGWALEFRVLGPVQALDGGRVLPVPAGRVRSLLAVLLLHANQVVTIDQLVDSLWPASPPGNPRAALQTNVRRLRQILTRPVLHTSPHGYQLELDPAQFDLASFRQLVRQAAHAEGVARVQLLSQALELWRGEPLADVDAEAITKHIVPRLDEERLHAREQLIDARLQLGHDPEVIAGVITELAELTRQHPLRERFWAQLMLALHRTGRQAEALQVYRTVSELLADQLGIDPGEELRGLHQSVLAATVPSSSRADQKPPAGQWATQCQLPLDVADFAGRGDVIAELEQLLTAGDGVPLVTVSGRPGVGKTALAIRVAHRLRTRFPDGQWYVRLDGTAASPRDPADLLAELLRTSGVTGAAIPDTLDARAATLRARLADRRVLLLLDDAGSAEQVRPLLPGSAGSSVLVTSRPDLAGLTVLEGGQGVRLGTLAPDDAAALLVGILGTGADRPAVAELAELCGYLPLALRIAAANIATRPGKSIISAVTELRTGNRLAKLAVTGDPQVTVRAAFDQSYAALAPELQRLFRLLGLVPGADFSAGAAAALLDGSPDPAGIDRDTVEQLLDRLATANLVQRQAADRYVFHDLLRLYAAELAESDPDHEAAWRRLCAWYLATTDAAIRFDYLPLVRLPGCPTLDGSPFTGAEQARQWLDSERANLAAAVPRAAAAGPPEFTWLLINRVGKYLFEGYHLAEWRPATETALDAAQASHNRLAEGAMQHNLGGMLGASNDLGSAITHEEIALECYRDAGERVGEFVMLNNLADSYKALGQVRQAAAMYDRAIVACRDLGMSHHADMELAGLSATRMHLGELDDAVRNATECLSISQTNPGHATRSALITRARCYRLTGQHAKASADLAEAMPIARRRLDPACLCELAMLHADTGQLDLALRNAKDGLAASRDLSLAMPQAEALTTVGQIHRLHGEHALAVAHHDDALRIATEHGYQAVVAEALLGLAQARLEAGERDAAHHHAQQALALAKQLELRITECRTLLTLAAIHRDGGDNDEASLHIERARYLQQETGYRPPVH